MIFADELARVVEGGWVTIAVAMDNTKPNHLQALHSCKTTAKEQLDKGWPELWPISVSGFDELRLRGNSQ
ncbi:MAG TPA: hypothetical protein VMF67_01680 [Rhizomicrobium sp.]|nr:hypothetical protein [Rhizomicrobium sp.]